MQSLKVALIHDYLVQNGGAEKTLEAIAELFPEAPIYTSIYDPKRFSKNITSKKIIIPDKTNRIFNLLPILSKYFTFLIPVIFENFNLDEFDVVISDSSSYSKGVLTKPGQMHISYIHTPPRFLYKYSVENTKRTAWIYRPVVTLVDHFLRIWDFNAAQRPDFLAANSKEIQKRIKKFYRRDSTVIYPPVELASSEEQTDKGINEKPGFYLVAGRLVAYKNFDVVIKAFNTLPDLTLHVIGTGPEEQKLKKLAGKNIVFLGRLNDEQKHNEMKNCLGLINSVQDEDFGIVPIEVLSHGRPVLAHRSAGHLETISENENGLFFDELTVECLTNKLREFDNRISVNRFDPEKIKAGVQKYSKENFKKSFYDYVMNCWNKYNSTIQTC